MQALDLGVGDGWSYLAKTLSVSRVDAGLTPDAGSVAELALAKFMRGEARAVEQVELAYIRTEVSWRKREKIRQV